MTGDTKNINHSESSFNGDEYLKYFNCSKDLYDYTVQTVKTPMSLQEMRTKYSNSYIGYRNCGDLLVPVVVCSHYLGIYAYCLDTNMPIMVETGIGIDSTTCEITRLMALEPRDWEQECMESLFAQRNIIIGEVRGTIPRREVLREKYGEQFVLVVDNKQILDRLTEGFNPCQDLEGWLANHATHSELRADIEYDDRYKQLISYIVVTDTNNVAVLQRIDPTREERLVGKKSIGVGGHVDIAPGCNVTYSDIICQVLEELTGELRFRTTPVVENLSFQGFLNLNQDSVSRHHLGMVFLCRVDSLDDVEIGEPDKLSLMTTPLEKLDNSSLEGWSQCLRTVLLATQRHSGGQDAD